MYVKYSIFLTVGGSTFCYLRMPTETDYRCPDILSVSGEGNKIGNKKVTESKVLPNKIEFVTFTLPTLLPIWYFYNLMAKVVMEDENDGN